MPTYMRTTSLALTWVALLAACTADDVAPGSTASSGAGGTTTSTGSAWNTGGRTAGETATTGSTTGNSTPSVGTTGGTTVASGTTGSSGGPDGGSSPLDDPDVCASVDVTANRITPQVTLVIDGSGSMAEPLGSDTSRWRAMETALLGQGGVVPDLHGVVEFGMTVYSTPIPQRGQEVAECPTVNSVAPALDNFPAINMAFPQRPPGGFTPTGEALQAVVDTLADQTIEEDGRALGEQIILLATDGEPNGCNAFQSLPYQELLDGRIPVDYGPTEAAVRAAQEKNIDTYVISLAPNLTRNAQSRGHLQTLANLGQGLEPAASPGAEIFSPADTTQLETAIRRLVSGVVTCDLELEGELVADRACDGEVLLNGNALACDDPNGWEVVDASTIRLLGTACDTWKTEAEANVDATFPCEVVVMLF